jgi:hypothetical protein
MYIVHQRAALCYVLQLHHSARSAYVYTMFVILLLHIATVPIRTAAAAAVVATAAAADVAAAAAADVAAAAAADVAAAAAADVAVIAVDFVTVRSCLYVL